MSFLNAAEFKVGMLVVTVGSLIAFMSMQISDDPSYLGRSRKAWFLIPNAGGLVKNSAVKTAGIPIGIIKDIKLQDGQARIEILIKSEVPLTQSASVEMRSQGILGDKYIEVRPGANSDPELADNGQILNIKDRGSLDNVITEVGEITGSLKTVAKVLKEAVDQDGTNKHLLGRIVLNIEKLTGDLAQMTNENKGQINQIVREVREISSSLKDTIKGDGESSGLKATMARLDRSMKNIEDITSKINNGEGTIGKLVSDEATAEKLDSAIDGLTNLVDTGSKITTGIDFHADYLNDIKSTKSYIGVKIQPGLDRYYYVAIVDDPAGVAERTKTDSTTNNTTTTTDQTVRYYNKTKLTALYAKNFWDWTIKGGLIESSGGIGVDYFLLRKKLKLSLEAFDFQKLNLRANAQYNLFHGIYVLGGMQDILNKSDVRSSYLGAGLFLTNDDLKLLLSKSPF